VLRRVHPEVGFRGQPPKALLGITRHEKRTSRRFTSQRSRDSTALVDQYQVVVLKDGAELPDCVLNAVGRRLAGATRENE
jgi:hypothetical protein